MFIWFSGWRLGHGTEERRWNKRGVSSQLHQETLAIQHSVSINQILAFQLNSSHNISGQIKHINCPHVYMLNIDLKEKISIEGPYWCFVIVFHVLYNRCFWNVTRVNSLEWIIILKILATIFFRILASIVCPKLAVLPSLFDDF